MLIPNGMCMPFVGNIPVLLSLVSFKSKLQEQLRAVLADRALCLPRGAH